MGRRIVVVGGTLSGPTAAARARETDESAHITIVQRGAHLSFAFGGLAHHLSGEVASLAPLDRQGADFFRDVYGIESLLHTEATALDLQRRVLTVTSSASPAGATTTTRELPFDALVFALGAQSLQGPVTGDNVWRVRDLAAVERVRALATAKPGVRAVVVGGGSFGLEAVDGLVRAGAQVTLVEQSLQPLPRFSTCTTAPLLAHLRARGVDVRLGQPVVRGEGTGGRIDHVVLHDGSRVACDLVVVCAGVRPRTALLQQAGVALQADGSVAVDRFARVGGRDDLYACGASVAVDNCVTGTPVWWAQAAIADKVAQVAGENAAGGRAQTSPFSGAMLVRALDVTLGRAGLSVDEAEAAFGAGDVDRSLVVGHSHEPWFPGAAPLSLLVVSRRSDGRVVGVEAVGARDVDKRIDVAACALAGGLTVDQLASLDLGYAGAFNATRDVLNTAARLASLERHQRGASITPAELRGRLGAGGLQIVDVGDDGIDGGAAGLDDSTPLAGAVLIPLERLRHEVDRLDARRPTVVVSSAGRRGFLAMRLLHQRGFVEVHNLAGGRRAWALEQAALPRGSL